MALIATNHAGIVLDWRGYIAVLPSLPSLYTMDQISVNLHNLTTRGAEL
jgi:hypothetical protein